ncbi:MAG: Glutamate racemase [Parcubacteria group bacterium GW2011_GWC2_39_14]|nr:MAG: Glutamate racemase [Parcubacteria group bacterium GW2011_GWC2_39_14]KKR54814.1 MAG: Glutamate racemase [Parcubacteria group bacterium GW2011_GWA2_40_23]
MIGIFDSGLGGLTVLKEIKKQLPDESYIYLGDTLHVPYGNRSDEAVYDLTRKACDFLFKRGCRLIILACNTATAKALRRLQQEYLPTISTVENNLNILGVIRPVAEFMAQKSSGRIGVIGTRGTVNSGAYVVELNNQKESPHYKVSPLNAGQAFKIEVFQQETPLLVPLIEEGWADSAEMDSILDKYLQALKEKAIDTLILGCTHYPLLIDKFRLKMSAKCFVPNPGEIVADSLKAYLVRHPEYSSSESESKVEYFVTDLSENFQTLAEQFLKEKIKINKIEI